MWVNEACGNGKITTKKPINNTVPMNLENIFWYAYLTELNQDLSKPMIFREITWIENKKEYELYINDTLTMYINDWIRMYNK